MERMSKNFEVMTLTTKKSVSSEFVVKSSSTFPLFYWIPYCEFDIALSLEKNEKKIYTQWIDFLNVDLVRSMFSSFSFSSRFSNFIILFILCVSRTYIICWLAKNQNLVTVSETGEIVLNTYSRNYDSGTSDFESKLAGCDYYTEEPGTHHRWGKTSSLLHLSN